MPGLVWIQRNRLAFSDRAKPAMPRADVAQYHERCRAFAPALEYVRTSSFLADGVQIQARNHLAHTFKTVTSVNSDFQPIWPRSCDLWLGHPFNPCSNCTPSRRLCGRISPPQLASPGVSRDFNRPAKDFAKLGRNGD